jgi:hypothetical protein
MEVTALATVAVTALSPYLVEGGKELTKGVVKDIWTLIKKPFSGKERDQALITQFAEQPNNSEIQNRVKYKLVDFLEEDPELVRDLETSLKKLPEVKMDGTGNISVIGDHNKVFKDISGSTIQINESPKK